MPELVLEAFVPLTKREQRPKTSATADVDVVSVEHKIGTVLTMTDDREKGREGCLADRGVIVACLGKNDGLGDLANQHRVFVSDLVDPVGEPRRKVSQLGEKAIGGLDNLDVFVERTLQHT